MLKKIFTSEGKDKTLALIAFFLMLFGFAVMAGAFFTDEYKGKIVNLISGFIFIIAAFFCFIGYRTKNK